jgi:hypothetical protein
VRVFSSYAPLCNGDNVVAVILRRCNRMPKWDAGISLAVIRIVLLDSESPVCEVAIAVPAVRGHPLETGAQFPGSRRATLPLQAIDMRHFPINGISRHRSPCVGIAAIICYPDRRIDDEGALGAAG